MRKGCLIAVIAGSLLVSISGCLADPKLDVSPSELDFKTQETQKDFAIRNVGDSAGSAIKGGRVVEGLFKSLGLNTEVLPKAARTLEYNIATNDTWISLNPSAGVCDGETDTVIVTIDRNSLIAGNNAGRIDIVSNGGIASVAVKAEKEVPPTAAFTADRTSGDAPLTVQFSDASSPGSASITAWSWVFGDGGASTLKNPSHTYANAGSYSVALTVTTSAGSDTATSGNYITVSAPKVVTGRWRNTLSMDTSSYTVYTQLTQNGTSLTGTFVFSDGSGFQNIGSSSYINDRSIKIYYWIGDYYCYLSGTVADDFESMSGGHYSSGTKLGAWSATKVESAKPTKSAQGMSIAEQYEAMLRSAE